MKLQLCMIIHKHLTDDSWSISCTKFSYNRKTFTLKWYFLSIRNWYLCYTPGYLGKKRQKIGAPLQKRDKLLWKKMYFFIKLQIVCFLTLLLLVAELVVDHFTHSLTLLVVAWQTLYNFLSLFISGVSLALTHNNSRELLKKVNMATLRL